MTTRSGYIESDDGLQLHWSLIGSGPLMICSNGVGVGTFFWKYICQRYSDRFSILLWDYRGHGNSDRDSAKVLKDVSIRRHTQDLELMYQTLFPENPPVILTGHSMGCQVALEFQRRNPQSVRALILLLGAAGKSLETFGNSRYSQYIFRLTHKFIRNIGPTTNSITGRLVKSRLAWPFTHKLALVDPYYTTKEDFWPYLEHMASMDILVFLAAAWECHLHNAWDSLQDIKIPTLIVAAEADSFFPIDIMKKLHHMIPNSEFLVLSGGSHAAIIEQPETINFRLDRFFSEYQLDHALPAQMQQ